jgi:sugar fermentation stimulation protein A
MTEPVRLIAFDPVPYLRATLLRREKRFILYLTALDGAQAGEPITAHINDPGRLPILQPGAEVWLRGPYPAPAKLAWRARLLRLPPPHDDAFISLDTTLANAVAAALAPLGLLPGIPHRAPLREVRRGDSRFDLVWPAPDDGGQGGQGGHLGGEHIAEAKTVSMIHPAGFAPWPDAPSPRAHKHLRHLIEVAESGELASLIFVTYHPAAHTISPAAEIDPIFAKMLPVAAAAGVQMVGYRAVARPDGIYAGAVLPVSLVPAP